MKLNIDIQDQNSTEVYNLTDLQACKLLEYIKNNNNIERSVVEYICKNRNSEEWISLSFRKFRDLYGTQYIPFKFQRPVDEKHVKTYLNIYEPNIALHIIIYSPLLLSLITTVDMK